MSLSFTNLGSGSAGNSTVVTFHARNAEKHDVHILVDAGFSPRQTALRLQSIGLRISDISALLITHLDHDHFYPSWVKTVEKYDISVHAHRRHRNRAIHAGIHSRHLNLVDDDPFSIRTVDGQAVHDFCIEPIMLAHDQLGSVGYIIEYHGVRLGYGTDIGYVPDSLIERMSGLDAIAFESNYDVRMQRQSGRPAFLKRRIMGGRGHLSNEQSYAAIASIASQSNLQQVMLLHLSRQCNDPALINDLYAKHAPQLHKLLKITSQNRPSPTLVVNTESNAVENVCAHPVLGQQLQLF